MSVIYIDVLSPFSLLAIVRSRIVYSHIFYFNTTSYGKRFAKIIDALGWLKAVPQEAEFQLSEVTDEKGNCQFFNPLIFEKSCLFFLSADYFTF